MSAYIFLNLISLLISIYFSFEIFAGLVRLQEILKATQDNDFEVTVRKLEMVNGNYISIMKELKNNGEFRIMVDCNTTFVKMILANVSNNFI